jgi:signal transduction histidine kinase
MRGAARPKEVMGTQLSLSNDDPAFEGGMVSAPIIERAPLPILEVSGSAHTVSHVNSAFCRLIGKSKAELLGKSFMEIVPGGQACVTVLDRVYQTGEGLIHVVEDDSEVEPACWLFAMWPALDKKERPVGAIIQLTKTSKFRRDSAAINEALLIAGLRQHEHIEEMDKLNAQLRAEVAEHQKTGLALSQAVADLKTAKNAAEGDSRAKDEFLAALSHELRTPLTPVLMAAAALREDLSLPAEAREQLAMMERNIDLEARLIDDLLDVTKIAHGKLQFRPERCDGHRLIHLAVAMVRADALAKEILIECAFIAKHQALHADPTRFQQVIWNLIRNAVKFTPAGGKISVRTFSEEKGRGEAWLRIEVSDSGIGIAPDQLEKIFEPFDQGSLSGAHHFGGIGLGLAIARAVIQLHGGRISAQSAGPGLGATFLVELPSAAPPESGRADSPSLLVAPSLAGDRGTTGTPPARLLLVEDHETSRQTMAVLLRRDGYHVVTAGTVADALVAARVNQFDLVVSDLGLPDGSGNELMGKLHDSYGLRGIALTGYGAKEDLARAREAGFVAHLVKPVSVAELRRTLSSLLASRS